MILKVKQQSIMLFIILCTGLSYFYLINNTILELVALGLAIVWGAYLWIDLRSLPNPKFEYGIWCVATIVLCVLSSWQSYDLFGQPMFLGLRAQRNFLVWALLYFPIRKMLYYNKLSDKSIMKSMKVVAVCELILFIAQYLLTDIIMFLKVDTGYRYDDIRYFFQPIVIVLFALICLEDFLKRKVIGKFLGILGMFCCIYEVMIIQKFRLTTVALLLCLGCGVFISKSKLQNRLVYLILAIIAAVVLYNTTMVQDVLDTLFNENTNSTLDIRELGRTLYLNTLIEHPLLGGGYPNQLYDAAYRASGAMDNINLADNGIFGFLYMYGGIGVIWVVSLWIKMISIGIKIFNKCGRVIFFLFPLFFVITSINEAHWYWMNGFMILVIFMAWQEETSSLTKGIVLK